MLLVLLALASSGAGAVALASAGALPVPSRISDLVDGDGSDESTAGSRGEHRPPEQRAESSAWGRTGSPRPSPRTAKSDRGRAAKDGCFANDGEIRSGRCEYGKPGSDTTVALFGDSKALHYFPALERIARKRGWRLIVVIKAGCPPMEIVKRGDPGERTECERWRESAFERIGSAKGLGLVIISANVGYQGVKRGVRTLKGQAREDAVRASYVAAIERLRRLGARVAVIKDNPVPPRDIPRCVARSLDRLGKCAFPVPADFERGIEERAMAAVEGARLVELTGAICPRGRCPAVIEGKLVYRNTAHLTATFARTLAPVIDRQLPRLRP